LAEDPPSFSRPASKHGNPEHERPCHGVTDGPGFAWQDPDELDFVSVGDIPPKLRIAWTMPSLQGRKMFLLSELAYYLRGPAMMEAALKAREAEMEKRSETEREGATVEGSFHTKLSGMEGCLAKRKSGFGENVDGSGRGHFCSGSSPRF